MQQWMMAAAVAPVLAAVGYFARRAIEGRRRGETLARRVQALALFKGMKQTGATLSDLDTLADSPVARGDRSEQGQLG